eukprot:Hpha_TRINITY_DN12619_c0_g1::TRINITY_DN12619_c0_g1_i1::g.49518::m.49518
MPDGALAKLLSLSPQEMAEAAGVTPMGRLQQLGRLIELCEAAALYIPGPSLPVPTNTETTGERRGLYLAALATAHRETRVSRGYRSHAHAFYSHYCPEKAGSVSSMVERRQFDPKRVHQMWSAMVTKYGTYPPREENKEAFSVVKRHIRRAAKSFVGGNRDETGSSSLETSPRAEEGAKWTRAEDNRRRSLCEKVESELSQGEREELRRLNEGFALFEQEGLARIERLRKETPLPRPNANRRRSFSSGVLFGKRVPPGERRGPVTELEVTVPKLHTIDPIPNRQAGANTPPPVRPEPP